MRLRSVIRRNTSLFKKISRFLGYFFLLIGLGYQIQRLYKKLKVEPEIFSKESSIQSSAIPFPAVTVCPPNTVKIQAWDEDYLRLNNLTINDVRGAHLLTCRGDHHVFIDYNKSDKNQIDILLKASPDFRDFFERCGINKYFSDHQNCEKIFIKSVTDKGICFTFNTVGYHSIFNKDVSTDFDIYKRTKVTKSWTFEDSLNEAHHDDKNDPQPATWSPETGYLDDSDNIQPVRALKMQELQIFTHSVINQTLCEGREKNFKIILHLPNEVPQMTYDAIDYPIGKEMVMLISAEVIHNEDSLRTFPPETRGCYFDGEKKLKFFESYTKGNCEYECLSNFTLKICGCVRFSMPRTTQMKVCEVLSGCPENVMLNFPRSYYEDPENKKKFPHYPCGCLPSCTEIKYKMTKQIRMDNDHSEKYRLSIIHVVFGESQIKKTSNYVTYEMENFIFDIGGLIGLFLGSSILSVLELIVDIFKAAKTRAEMVFKWFYPRADSAEPEDSIQPQSTDTIDEIISSGVDEMSAVSRPNRDMRMFSISRRHDLSSGLRTIQQDDLNVEDLDN